MMTMINVFLTIVFDIIHLNIVPLVSQSLRIDFDTVIILALLKKMSV